MAGLNVSEQNQSATASKDPLIGKQLGDYRITSRLASGGMARVYKGMDYKLQRPAAIKVLELHNVEHDETITARFKREARAVAALEHPNIIPIYQYGEDEDTGVYFLAMKLIKGRDLADELRRLRKSRQPLMDVDRALLLMEQVASALDYAHSQDIVHRDVKPSNILIDKDDHALLTDLGLVLRVSAETTLGTAFGTPRYIAPEQATSSDKAVPQSDVYSFGVILYEILCGRTPFDGESPMEIALAHISDAPPPPRQFNASIPESVEKELLKSLEKDPTKRHKSTTQLIEAVKRGYGMGQSTRAGAVSLPTKAAPEPENDERTLHVPPSMEINKPVRKRPNALIALAALALVIVAAFVLSSIIGSGGPTVAAGGAPVTLIYDENTFTLINEGDYDLDVQALKFVRGVDDNVDDFSGDRIPRDVLPANKNCFQIVLSTGTSSIPPQCNPISQHRHGQETLSNPRLVPWRSETQDNGRLATFEVIYNGQLLTRCDTVARGGFGECRFTWPVVPE
jgi:serine/threonine protein kinase